MHSQLSGFLTVKSHLQLMDLLSGSQGSRQLASLADDLVVARELPRESLRVSRWAQCVHEVFTMSGNFGMQLVDTLVMARSQKLGLAAGFLTMLLEHFGRLESDSCIAKSSLVSWQLPWLLAMA